MIFFKRKIILAVLIAVFLIVAVSAGFFYFWQGLFGNGGTESAVEINNHKFAVEIADESSERRLGLGGRENLCDDCGMFFLFNEPDYYSFWMKDMKFPLDFIWIAGNQVIDIDKNIPSGYPGILKPEIPADKVLEVNAGACGKYGIEEGNEAEFYLKRGG